MPRNYGTLEKEDILKVLQRWWAEYASMEGLESDMLESTGDYVYRARMKEYAEGINAIERVAEDLKLDKELKVMLGLVKDEAPND